MLVLVEVISINIIIVTFNIISVIITIIIVIITISVLRIMSPAAGCEHEVCIGMPRNLKIGIFFHQKTQKNVQKLVGCCG